jgi:hypothetical protein
LAFGFAVDATTHGSRTEGGAAALQGRLQALEQRAHYLERAAGGGHIDNKVVAPFEVVDAVRRQLFYIDSIGSVRVLAGKSEAVMSAGGGGGNFAAFSASGDLAARLSALPAGLQVSENYKDRVTLGRDPIQGDYRLKFMTEAKKDIAAIGEDPKTHTGLALVYDPSGNLKARMAITTDARGLVDVLGGKKLPIAQLTESTSGGGKLWLGNASGVGMVEAGDAGGYGIVKAGPKGFETTPVILALPGSVISGKH